MISVRNLENKNHEHAPIDIDVANTSNLTNKNVQHIPIEMIMTNTPNSTNIPNVASQVEWWMHIIQVMKILSMDLHQHFLE